MEKNFLRPNRLAYLEHILEEMHAHLIPVVAQIDLTEEELTQLIEDLKSLPSN